jgi:DNA-binding MarR family transcriptional regulator
VRGDVPGGPIKDSTDRGEDSTDRREGSTDSAVRRSERQQLWEAARAREEAVVTLPFVLRQGSRAVDALLRRTLVARGLADVSLTGLDILGLARIARPIVALGERLKISPQAAGRVVATLEAAGLVEKRPGYRDGRQVLVEITPDGSGVLRVAHDAIMDALHLVADDVVEGRLADLTEDLATIAWVDRERHPWNRW